MVLHGGIKETPRVTEAFGDLGTGLGSASIADDRYSTPPQEIVNPLAPVAGKTPDSRMRPTVAVRQSSCGMSLLRSRTARLKSRHCPTPDNLAPLYGDTLTSIPRPEGRKWGNHDQI